MRTTWTLQDAKNSFSEVVEQALAQGPQTITRRGKETAVLISAQQFRALSGGKDSLLSFFRKSPLKGVDLDLRRSRDMGRNVSL